LGGVSWLDRPAPRRAPVVPYVAAGLGLLVKGPLAVLLVAGPLALAALVQRPRPRVAELGLARGTLAVVALGALLYVPVGLLDARYLSAFAATHVRRLGSESPHAGPIHYYLLWLPALLLPWTLFAPGRVRRASPRAATSPARCASSLPRRPSAGPSVSCWYSVGSAWTWCRPPCSGPSSPSTRSECTGWPPRSRRCTAIARPP